MGPDPDKPAHSGEHKHPRWTLVVEGLGKIKRARVRAAPLTLLVGENNTGKSYLATLLWGFRRYLDDILSHPPEDLSTEKACNEWIRTFLARSATATLAPPASDIFLKHANEILQFGSSELLAHAFNRRHLSLARLALEDLAAAPIQVEFCDLDGNPSAGTTLTGDAEADRLVVTRRSHGETAPPSDDARVVSMIRQLLTVQLVDPDDHPAFYLPASRTGFMLLYPEVIKRDIERRKIGTRTRREVPAELTAPMIEFLEFLALGSRLSNEGPHRDLADALEAHLHGTLEIASDIGTRRFAFRPEGGAPLPMAMSSSLVTELTPIIAALRHEDFGFIVLEEPEAHLHPELQCVMARLLVRLVRRGVQVCVTTHSENFCQQINNLLKIGRLRDLGADVSGYGLGPDEYLKPEDVAAYEFRRADDGTDVVALETTADGIAMPLFNRTLMRLTGETVDLQRAIDALTPAEPES